MSAAIALVLATAFVLGIRHGLDWDHLSAITDLTGGAARGGYKALALATSYCIGHGSVIVVLGALVGLVGVRLPRGLDRAFEIVVGLTLVGLGLVVLTQVVQRRSEYRFTSRWRLAIELFGRMWPRRAALASSESTPRQVSPRVAFGIGVLHGTGAETPTQVALFATAAASGTTVYALLVLVAFAAGLLVADLAVAVVWLNGRLASARIPFGDFALGLMTGCASVCIGVAFIAEKSTSLPSIFGG